eukprot:714948-Hanusia_phi.AAC.1
MDAVSLDETQATSVVALRLVDSYASLGSSSWTVGVQNLPFYLVQSTLSLFNFSVQNDTLIPTVALLYNQSTIESDRVNVVYDNLANTTEWCASITDEFECSMFACCSWDGACSQSGSGLKCSDCSSSNLCTATTGSSCHVMGFTSDYNLVDSQCVWKP